MKRLIVNADDFGLSPGVNRAVRRLFREGILTSTTLLANAEGFGEAAAMAGECEGLSVGIHLNFTLGRPLSPPSEIASLVDTEGTFLRPPDLYRRLLFGAVRRGDLEREIRRQIERCLSAGFGVSHIDSHKHLHVHPRILKVAAPLAAEYGVGRMRLPLEPFAFMGCGGAPAGKKLARALMIGLLARKAKKKLRRQGIRSPERFFGITWAGGIHEGLLARFLRRLPEGTTELSCHPGEKEKALSGHPLWLTDREGEYRALLSPTVRDEIKRRGIRLIGYRDLEAVS